MNLSAVATVCVTLFLGACGKDSGSSSEPSAGGAASAAEAPPARPLRDVLGATLTRLGVEAREGELSAAELRADTGLLPGDAAAPAPAEPAESMLEADPADPESLDPEYVEMREGLLGWVKDSPDSLATARKDIAAVKDEIAPVMAAGFHVEGRDAAELKVLIDLSLASPTAAIAAEVANVAATHEEDWLRRYAAWALGNFAETDGADQVIPLLIRRLKYERDAEALVWVSSTLAAFGNYAGTQRLYDTTSQPLGDAAGDAARGQLAIVLERAAAPLQLEETPDTDTVLAAWTDGRLGRDRATVSDALLGEVWLLVADLSGEHFQLRGVDDGRHTLSLLGPWAAGELALALEDDDEYVRLHTAQVLERMGPRGQAAFDSLVAALHDPHDAVCGAAAETLVSITRGTPEAEGARAALLDRMSGRCPYEIKVACVRALAHMDASAIPVAELTDLFETTPLSDLRLAAAPGLLAAGSEDLVLPWLIDELEAPVGDPAGAEAVLGDWLEQADSEVARASLEAWQSHAAPMSVVHTAAQAKARRAARAGAMREALSDREPAPR